MDFVATISWRPGIGDPSLLGWLTVVTYAIAALLCARASLVARRVPCSDDDSPGVWALFALMLLLLGINKQMDLQTLLIEAGRQLAVSQGWYAKRRAVQTAFTLLLAAGILLTLGWMVGRTRQFVARHPLAALGTALLLSYVLVRTSSFDHFGASMGIDLDHLKWAAALELGGIACLAVAAARGAAQSHVKQAAIGDERSS